MELWTIRLDIYASVSEETSRKTDRDCDKKKRERKKETIEGNVKEKKTIERSLK